jgi:hypothetical protein
VTAESLCVSDRVQVKAPSLSAPSVIAAPSGSAAGMNSVRLLSLCVCDRVQVKAPSLSAPSVIAAPSGSAAGMNQVRLLFLRVPDLV